MVGASGTFTNLHYPNQTEVPGLVDSSSQGGSAFYSLRVSKRHYLGAVYQYQRLLSYPTLGTNETQTHAAAFFLHPVCRRPDSRFRSLEGRNTQRLARSGRQRRAPEQRLPPSPCPTPASRSWNPTAGGSLSWQGHLTSVAVSYAHLISSGGGLIGAVRMDSASASIRQQLTRRLSASVAGGYTQNDVLAAPPRVQRQRTHGFGNGIVATAVWPAPESAAGIHAASSGLQRGCRPGCDSQHQSRICFDFLSVLQTAGKIIYG